MRLNEAVSARLSELLRERGVTNYRLYMQSGLNKVTIGNVMNCKYESVKRRVLHEICQGLDISLREFFASDLFDEQNLEP